MKQKLDAELVTNEMKQSCIKKKIIPFRDSAIDKLQKQNIEFGSTRQMMFKLDVPRGSSLRGLNIRVSRATGKRDFVLSIWFNKRNQYYTLGTYPIIKCKDVEKLCLELAQTHQDERGLWIRNPIKTRIEEKRITQKPDPTTPKAYTTNEIIEAYCGADLPGETTERGFSKDKNEGYRRAKSCTIWLRYLVGYNKRASLVRFIDDADGYGKAEFVSNKHLRIKKPETWREFFKKFPPGTGLLKDRVYYNRRRKQTYTIEASKNISIYDGYLGKSIFHELTPGDIESWISNMSSAKVKQDYVDCFVTLWKFARKRGWLGTNPGLCPFNNGQIYIKKGPVKEDPYKDVAMESPEEFQLFWECSEELAPKFPFKAELHQFMVLTAIRKSESLRMKKEYINFDKGILFIPKEISKTGVKDEQLPITPELEILLRNILDYENHPLFSNFYRMKDFPWLFASRRWGASSERYFNKEFKMSEDARLGTDDNYVPALRELMRTKSGDPDLQYAPKILRKSYITLSQQKHAGRSEITKQMSRHTNINILNNNYNKPSIETKRDYASKVTEGLRFIRRRSA